MPTIFLAARFKDINTSTHGKYSLNHLDSAASCNWYLSQTKSPLCINNLRHQDNDKQQQQKQQQQHNNNNSNNNNNNNNNTSSSNNNNNNRNKRSFRSDFCPKPQLRRVNLIRPSAGFGAFDATGRLGKESRTTLHGTNTLHLGKRKVAFKRALVGMFWRCFLHTAFRCFLRFPPKQIQTRSIATPWHLLSKSDLCLLFLLVLGPMWPSHE